MIFRGNWLHLGVLLAMAPFSGCGGDPRTQQLHQAVRAGDAATVEELLDSTNGLDINAKDRGGMTALHHAMDAKQKEVYSLLLSRGADPNLCDGGGQAAMHLAAENEDPFWLREALAHGGNANALNVGNRYEPECTPLFYALGKRRVENVRLLVKAGANVNHRTRRGRLPLTYVWGGSGSWENALELIQAGADIQARGPTGQSHVELFDNFDASVFEDAGKPHFEELATLLIDEGLISRGSDGVFHVIPSPQRIPSEPDRTTKNR